MERSQALRQLFDACTEGNVAAVTSLLDSGVDINAADTEDVTALQLAAASGHEHVVRLLLVRGAAVDQANLSGWTPLLHAARNGHAAVAALLIQNHASINAQTCYGTSVACLAARSGNVATCRLLEGAGISFSVANEDEAVSSAGCTLQLSPLSVAAHYGHDSVIKHLLSSTDVNQCIVPIGVTPLMSAVVSGHVSTTRLLVERSNVNIDAVDINDKSALDYSIAQGHRQVQEYLETMTTRTRYTSQKDSAPRVIVAVKHGNVELVQDILDADISQRDTCSLHDGATPLMFAAMIGNMDIVKLLVGRGCDLNRQDSISGWTALMQALFHGNKDIAVFLVKAGADVAVAAKSGCTAFDMASFIGDVDTELYRLLASRAVPLVPHQHHQHRSLSSDSVTRSPNSGIRAWWSRISKRFHNLKQPQNLHAVSRQHSLEAVEDTTLRSPSVTSTVTTDSGDVLLKSLSTNPLSALTDVTTPNYSSTANCTVRTMLSPAAAVNSRGPAGSCSTLRSVVAPVFQSPAFHTDTVSRTRPASSTGRSRQRKHAAMTPVNSSVKLPQSQHSTLNLVNRVASPPPRVQFAKRPHIKLPSQTDVSPSASYNATSSSSEGTLTATQQSRLVSSTSSSTLTAGSETKPSPSADAKHKLLHNHTGALKLKPTPTIHHQSQQTNGDHPRDNQSSITVDRVLAQNSAATAAGSADELTGILHRLSLERYQPVFDEQEVDMEAFLTLTDYDLQDLGIQSSESRRQILAAISELNTSKDRQRLHYENMISSFNNATLTESTALTLTDS